MRSDDIIYAPIAPSWNTILTRIVDFYSKYSETEGNLDINRLTPIGSLKLETFLELFLEKNTTIFYLSVESNPVLEINVDEIVYVKSPIYTIDEPRIKCFHESTTDPNVNVFTNIRIPTTNLIPNAWLNMYMFYNKSDAIAYSRS